MDVGVLSWMYPRHLRKQLWASPKPRLRTPLRRMRVRRPVLLVALGVFALAGFLAGQVAAQHTRLALSSAYQDARTAHLYASVDAGAVAPALVIHKQPPAAAHADSHPAAHALGHGPGPHPDKHGGHHHGDGGNGGDN